MLNISTGGSLKNTIELRFAPALRFSPEICSLNRGSMTFSVHPLAKRYDSWKFDWEKDYVENSDIYIFRNTFRDISTVAKALAPHQIKFEHQCYDVGHLYNLCFCLDIGLFNAPIFIQFIFGILGGIGPEVDNLVFMKRPADRLFGADYHWSVLGAGGAQMGLATTASQKGANVRVGLEDCLHIARDTLAASHAQQVATIRRIVEDLGCEIASPDEAREILGPKGGDRVGFCGFGQSCLVGPSSSGTALDAGGIDGNIEPAAAIVIDVEAGLDTAQHIEPAPRRPNAPQGRHHQRRIAPRVTPQPIQSHGIDGARLIQLRHQAVLFRPMYHQVRKVGPAKLARLGLQQKMQGFDDVVRARRFSQISLHSHLAFSELETDARSAQFPRP